MLTNSEIRKKARTALEGNWGKAVIATIIYWIINSALSISVTFSVGTDTYLNTGGTTLVSLLCLPLQWGFMVFFLYFIREEEPAYERLFSGYKQFIRIFTAMLLEIIYIFLWSLLLIVPGIIKCMSYAMTEYVLLDNPELSATEAIHRSRVMMDGHKMKLFLMLLSFIGWFLLCLLTLGLGFLLLVPYIRTSLAAFYQDLKDEEEALKQTPTHPLDETYTSESL